MLRSSRRLVSARSSVLFPRASRLLSTSNKINDRVFVMSNDTKSHHSPILLGLMNTLSVKYPSVGFFRPIAPSRNPRLSDHHTEVLASEFKLTDSKDHLVGVYNDDVVQARLKGDLDSITEAVLAKFEVLKAKHDFVVIEGACFETAPELAWDINVELAKAVGAPVLLTSDLADVELDDALTEAERDAKLMDTIATRVLLGKDAVEEAGLTYVGSIANRVNAKNPHEVRKRVQALLHEKGEKDPAIFLGALPVDSILGSKRLNEVVDQLRAKQLYGPVSPNSIVVTDGFVGTSDIKDLFGYMKTREDGLLVIVSADRTDVMLGLLVSKMSGALPNVAAVILTNGKYPQDHVKDVLEGIAKIDNASIPIYTVEGDSYKTANAFSRVKCDILPSSQTKIQQCYILFDKYIARDAVVGSVSKQVSTKRTPKQFKHFLFSKARQVQQHIVLTEGEDDRILQAADEVLRRDIAKLTILGEVDSINARAKALRLDLSRANIIDPTTADDLDQMAARFYEKRKIKGVSEEVARQSAAEATCYGTLMVEMGIADGMVSGACHTTANTVRPALQLIKTRPDSPLVSSFFFMCLDHDVVLYGDCAINTDPTAEDLANIAMQTAESAKAFGTNPRVALLSYATGDSNKGPIIDKVREATRLAQQMAPEIPMYGPIQYDAAMNPIIAKQKVKGLKKTEMEVAGNANVLIFPDLNTGNNTYKAVQQSTNCLAMGPVLQGLNKPVNDLSRGATVGDIVTTIAITAIQADQMNTAAKAKSETK
ncbi:phosphate acetyltransferase [Thraustotheca clavata]|uniref:Phosphate acetyltransferase n=1 Tax=Thraustotheca clavata TaxID=74557 RepID=A0A1V9ZFZ4_9STRA|nr:phosphate acetyltransferase [Thraustotheca clavata]